MKILCAGGGTLGSVTPLLAVIEEIKKRHPEVEVEWWGTENGPERELVKSNNITFQEIVSGKLRRYVSLENIVDIFRIIVGFWQAIWYLGSNKPNCLLTAGSYVAVPVAWAAYLYGVPVFAHQQDVRPSLANKLISPVASKITVALAESIKDFSSDKVILTGNPVRQVFLEYPNKDKAKEKLGLDPARPVVLVMGGGTGAQFLNNLVSQIKNDLIKVAQIIHVTGIGKNLGTATNGYKMVDLTNESVDLFAASDVVITRAGMGTLTELSALHKPAIVVPIPQSHQEDNAKYFSDKGAVIMIRQEELTSHTLLATVSQIINNKETSQKLGEKISEVLPTGASAKIADLVEEQVYQK